MSHYDNGRVSVRGIEGRTLRRVRTHGSSPVCGSGDADVIVSRHSRKSVIDATVTPIHDSPWIPRQRDCRELARLEWRVGDPGNPADVLEDFLTEHGLPIGDLAAPSQLRNDSTHTGVTGNSGVGARVFLSAAASAVSVGFSAGPLSPSAAIPDLVAVIEEPPVHQGQAAQSHSHTQRQHAEPPHASRSLRWVPSWSEHDHATAVSTVREAIAAGEVYQANVVGHSSAQCSPHPDHTLSSALEVIRNLPGATWGADLAGDGWALASGSPECLLAVADGRIATKPIKGTRPRTSAGRQELLASEKERAEHIMIVDLARNDLAQIAEVGSVTVDDLFAGHEWCNLWQAESTVSAKIAPGVGLAAIIQAICPGGSVTGAPKRAAWELLAGLEPVGRGPAMGALGYITPSRVEFGLTIRTVALAEGQVHCWAGGGITWGSDPDAEVAEANAKAVPLRAALEHHLSPPS